MGKKPEAPVGSENPLAQLMKPPAYRAARASVFASDFALDWYIRQNRDALFQAGALLMITGRKWINPTKFDQAVIELGSAKVVA